MKKSALFRGFLLSSMAVAVAACGNLSDVSDEGTTTNPIFPNLEDYNLGTEDTQRGTWPNWENVRQVERGMNKHQLRTLIGSPHFEEGLYGVREWDYLFNYRENGEHKTCQFKVLFDKNMTAQSFFWYPNGCNSNEITHSSFKLDGDFSFDFNKDVLSEKGEEIVDDIARQLKDASSQQVQIAGYADRLGSDSYNQTLSQRRANAVKARLQQQGVTGQIEAVGYGKAKQVVACHHETGQALRDCLRPNRRVEINAGGTVLKQQAVQQNSGVAGQQGPAPLYKTPAHNSGK
ncbi:SmpA/OmlA family protein [Nicoletella semolina]|uniref:SmpA/OmlA family protein n=1 Tax=Nicoletella semolina TaxID=271160 RepID=A0A4V2SK50_9PAST|nr:OmpA family protein [Nicoletella semolina]MDH2923982.1 plastocyanin [Nicoletella semolina]TCP18116.1 SmpA/OmlA family protein [Nicoletella semolina]